MAGCVWKYVGAVVIYSKYYQLSERKRRRRARKGRRRSGQLRNEGVAKNTGREKEGGELELDDRGGRGGWTERRMEGGGER